MDLNLDIREKVEKRQLHVYVSDGVDAVRFTRHKKGVCCPGVQKVSDLVENYRSLLQHLGLTDSALDVLISLSGNCSNLDAVDTGGSDFMTFGMLRWSIGAGSAPGELAALLAKIKKADALTFERYYGRFGLDIELEDNRSYGFLSINGQRLETPADKARMRGLEWAYLMWKSGQDLLVQVAQVQHAWARLDTFYRSDRYMVGEYYIADLITSEYGVVLILDNHISSPGCLKSCLNAALQETWLPDPRTWDTEAENRFIEAYLKIRAVYGAGPMVNAYKRARTAAKHAAKGLISMERGSFRYKT